MEIIGLRKVYPVKKGPPVVALNGIDLDLPDRGMLFIVGKTGCGKTTLLNLLAGLDEPTSGRIIFRGKNIAEMNRNELENYRNVHCGIVFQNYCLIDDLSVGDNVSLSLELQGTVNGKKEVLNALKQVGLEGYENRRISELSGGQKQRVAIARAIVKSPDIIFADEPTGALDEETSDAIFGLLKDISKNTLVLTVSHDSYSAKKYADAVVRLSEGKVTESSVVPIVGASEIKRKGKAKKAVGVPRKTAAKIGLGIVRKHPIRFAVALGLSVLSFLFFCVPLSMALWDNQKAYINNVYDDHVRFSGLSKYKIVPSKSDDLSLGRFFGDENVEHKPVPFTEEDVSYLEDIAGSPLIRENNNEIGYWTRFGSKWRTKKKREEFLANYEANVEDHYIWKTDGFVGLDKTVLDFLQYKILAGKLPQTKEEVAVPECLYNTFAYFGLTDSDGREYVVSCPEDLLGHNLDIAKYSTETTEPQYVKITAVIDTGCDKLCSENHFTDGDASYGFHDKLYMCNDYFSLEDLKNDLIYPTPENREDFRKMTDFSAGTFADEKNNGRMYIRMNNKYSDILYLESGDVPMMVARLCLYLGIVFLCIALSLMFQYVSSSVGGRSRQAGILIASGFTKKDLLKTYGTFAFFLCMAISVLTLLLFFPVGGLMNAWFMREFSEGVKMCRFHPIMPLVMFLASAGVSAFSCLIPVYGFMQQPSAALISGRKRKG